jgi:hypothetical protein
MKTRPLAAAVWLLGAAAAGAQEPAKVPLNRGDIHFVMGWQNLHKPQPGQPSYNDNDWVNGIFYGGAGTGWYWTEHVKTQVDFGAGTRGRQYRFENRLVNGQTIGLSSVVRMRQQNLAVAQQYQFFRNQWFHPHVAAGIDLTWETTTERAEPVILYPTQQPGPPRVLREAAVIGPDTRLRVRPFGEVGFKAYVSTRGFLRSDLRMLARNGIDEVQVRFGFGVDF